MLDVNRQMTCRFWRSAIITMGRTNFMKNPKLQNQNFQFVIMLVQSHIRWDITSWLVVIYVEIIHKMYMTDTYSTLIHCLYFSWSAFPSQVIILGNHYLSLSSSKSCIGVLFKISLNQLFVIFWRQSKDAQGN